MIILKLKENISYIIQVIFLVLFYWLFLNVLIVNQVYANKNLFNPIIVVLFIILFFIICLTAYHFIFKYTKWFTKYEGVLLFFVLFFMFLLQLDFGILLETNPNFDYEAVYRGAIQWLTTGNLGSYQSYFYTFPNNLGCLFLLKIFFQALSVFGIKTFYLAGTVLVCIIFEVAYYLVFLIVKHLYGVLNAFMALILCALVIPIYFYSSIFYTDTLTFVFPVLIYFLYIQAKDASSRKVTYLLFVSIGIVTAIGMTIKISVLFMLIAIFIDLILTLNIKQYIFKICVCFLSLAIVIIAFQTYIYNCGILDKSIADTRKIPYSHWLSMTLVGDGTYNNNDYSYIYTFPTTKQMDQAAWKKYFQRLNNYGVSGYIVFLNRKQITTWGNGTYDINEFLRTRPVNKTFLHDFVLDGGKYNIQFSNICQGFYIGMFSFILLYIFMLVRKRRRYKYTDNKSLAVYIVILGLFIFFLVWEANARYIINYIPIFIIAAVPGINIFYNRITKKKKNISS
jgi:hypothetical protein